MDAFFSDVFCWNFQNTKYLEFFFIYLFQSHSISGMMDEYTSRPHQQMRQLSLDEKKFLLAVERGDIATSRR